MVNNCHRITSTKGNILLSLLQQINTQNASYIIKQLGSGTENLTNRPDLWDARINDIRLKLQTAIDNEVPGNRLTVCFLYRALWNYIPPIIFLLGTIGNILIFLVLKKRSMIQISFYVYLATLAIVDQLILVFALLRHWVDRLIGERIEDMSAVLCKLSQLLGTTTSFLSVWLIVALTVERFIVIRLPLRANQIATPRRAKILTLFLALLCLTISLHFLFTVDLVTTTTVDNTQNRSMCEFSGPYRLFSQVWTWIDAALYSYLPFLLITTINIANGVHVRRAISNRAFMMSSQPHHQRNAQSQTTTSRLLQTDSVESSSRAQNRSSTHSTDGSRQLTAILFTVSCAFLLTTTPIVVIKFLSLTLDFTTVDQLTMFQFIDSLGEMLMHTNHAMNFYLYCATGTKFRHELVHLLCRRSRKPLAQSRCLQPVRSTCAERSAVTNFCHASPQDSATYKCHNGTKHVKETFLDQQQPPEPKEPEELELL